MWAPVILRLLNGRLKSSYMREQKVCLYYEDTLVKLYNRFLFLKPMEEQTYDVLKRKVLEYYSRW
jgi:hypothetical protein